MYRQRKKLRFLLVVLLVFLTAGSTLSVSAERDTVRIGYYWSEKYGYTGPDGELYGYDVHLCKTIAMYGGFNAEMVSYANVTELEEALRGGEVDVLIDFIRTGQREKEFIFTNNPVLEEQVSVYTNNVPDAPSAYTAEELGALRIGYVARSGFLDYFQDYCAEQGIAPRLVDYYDETEMHAAMDRGDTDACMTGSAVPVGYRVLVSLPPISSYMMLRPEDIALCRRIDNALSQIKTDNPDYVQELYQRYVVSHNTEMSPLSALERAYLAKHPELTVALVRGAEPFTVEQSDGNPDGIIPDYYRMLEKKLGVSFRFIVYDETQEAVDAVAAGKTDILGHFYGNILIAERDNLYDTMEYGTTECARLTRSGFTGEVRTVAVTDRTRDLVAEQLHADIRLATYPNNEACYQTLMRGEADAMIGSMTGVSWLVNQHTMRGVSLSVLPEVALAIRGAVSRENPTLLFILNKAIAVSGSDLNEAVLENTVRGETSLRTALENLPLGFSIAVVAVLLILVIALIVTLVLLARSSRERVSSLNREMNMDGLTGAGSRRYGKELLHNELLLYKKHGTGPLVAMFDVDHFKTKNDTYGHEYGDFVLKKVVESLRASLRQTDELIRWGGDEFILVCPGTRSGDAGRLLEKVVQTVNGMDYRMDGKGEPVTVSIGASFFRPEDEDIIAVLRRCDIALYRAKSLRNTGCLYSDELDGEKDD